MFAPILAGTHPALLISLALKYLRKSLPADQIEREEQQRRERREQREQILAKPEAERTEVEKRFLNLGREILPPSHVSDRDWQGLCVDDGSQTYWPPSPLREPFHSLFTSAPQHGLELFTALSNHAVQAWRQLHRLDHERGGTPIPLEIRFPWGVQQFWGDAREYLWSRGIGEPHALACCFLALEAWCFAELERGRDVDELIQQIVTGNKSVGILGVAVTLILHTQRLSETGFAIVTAQRLWSADVNRMVHDQTDGNGRLIGFNHPADREHVAAIKAANARPVRGVPLRRFVVRYVLSETFGERTEQAGLAFKDRLPFQYEEEARDEAARAHFLKLANDDAEVCVRKNYRIRRSPEREGMLEVLHESPSASTPERVRQIEELNRSEQQARLWLWVSKSFENDKVGDSLSVPEAMELARELDERSLFKPRSDEDGMSVRRGAVAGAAAVVLKFRDGRTRKELKWARTVLARASNTPEVPNAFWTAGAIVPWHPLIFVARGLVADIRNGTAGESAKKELLALVAHPLEVVALAAGSEVVSLWDWEAKFVWATLCLAFDLCRVEPPTDARVGDRDPIHSPERVKDALAAAIRCDEHPDGWAALPLPPPAWIKCAEQPPSEGRAVDAEDRTYGGLRGERGEWTEPRTKWHSEYAGKVLARVPFQQVLATDARQPALVFLMSMLEWTNAKNEPPWQKNGRNRESLRFFGWTAQLGSTLGDVAGYLSGAEVQARFLEPIFALRDEACWSLLSAFSSSYICRYIYDAPVMPEGTVDIVGLCIDRFLKAPAFKKSSYSAGKFTGWAEPRLLETLMFVAVERADEAARYVNGDWSQVDLILPLVDRVVRAGGWSTSVMANFLTFCERARQAYPADQFAEQVLAVIGDDGGSLKGWFESSHAARIAGLVQFFADRETPMSASLAQRMLRILDILVDMGDRRSAALELSEVFREVTV